jgi:hypothetical protein
VNLTAYFLFFLAGLGFGYAAPGRWKWLALVFPLVLAAGALVKDGVDAAILLRLVIALIITGAGVVLGTIIDSRTGERSDQPQPA